MGSWQVRERIRKNASRCLNHESVNPPFNGLDMENRLDFVFPVPRVTPPTTLSRHMDIQIRLGNI